MRKHEREHSHPSAPPIELNGRDALVQHQRENISQQLPQHLYPLVHDSHVHKAPHISSSSDSDDEADAQDMEEMSRPQVTPFNLTLCR